MKERISKYYSKHKDNCIEFHHNNKFIETLFIYNDKKFFIRIWTFMHKEKEIPLYKLYNNSDNIFFVNVEISNHSLRTEFIDSMLLSLENDYIMKINTEFCSNFNNDEKKYLYKLIQNSNYSFECIAENKEFNTFIKKYNEDKVNIILKLFIVWYNNWLKYINIDYFGEDDV